MLNPSQKRRTFAKVNRFTKIKGSAGDWLGKNRGTKPNIIKVYESFGRTVGKKSGRATLAICPYHSDSKASLALYSDNSTFYCFTCLESGNAYQLVIDELGMDFKGALQYCQDNNLYDY